MLTRLSVVLLALLPAVAACDSEQPTKADMAYTLADTFCGADLNCPVPLPNSKACREFIQDDFLDRWCDKDTSCQSAPFAGDVEKLAVCLEALSVKGPDCTDKIPDTCLGLE